MERIGLYLRISDDHNGQSTATSRQRSECLELAKYKAVEIADCFEDSDISGYKGVKRPEFERLIEAVRNKEIDGVMAWKLDRFGRNLKDFVRLLEAVEKTGARFITKADGLDSKENASTWKMQAGLYTVLAESESTNMGIRIKAMHRERASKGEPSFGQRIFGYAKNRRDIIPAEAVILAKVADDLLAGRSMNAVLQELRGKEIKTARGNYFGRSTMRQLICSYQLSGQRHYNGQLIQGNWQGILTADQTARLRRMLLKAPRVAAPRRYLLAGLVFCGHCQRGLTSRSNQGVRRYVCVKDLNDQSRLDNCGHLSRAAEPIETYLIDRVCEQLDNPVIRSLISGEGLSDAQNALHDEIAEVEALLIEFAKDRARGWPKSEYEAARAEADARLDGLRSQLKRSHGSDFLMQVMQRGEYVRANWEKMTFAWQVQLIRTLVARIELVGSVRGRRDFDAQTVRITYRC